MMLWWLLHGCWPWIPRPERVDSEAVDSEAVDTVLVETEAPDSEAVDSEPVDSEAAPSWRAVLVLDQVRGDGSSWATASLCVDGRVGTSWTDRYVEQVGGCRVAPSATACLAGPSTEVHLRSAGADSVQLPFDAGRQRHEADAPVVAVETTLGWRSSAWTGGPPAGTWDDVLRARPLGDLVITAGAPVASGGDVVFGLEPHLVQWSPVEGAWVYVAVVALGPPYEVVRCLVDAELGEISLEAALFEGWQLGQDVDFSVSLLRARENEPVAGVLPIGVDRQVRAGFGRVHGP
jgi:hypothetical protein